MLVTKSVTTETDVLENLETKVAKTLVAKSVATKTDVFGRYAKMRYADWYAWKRPFQTAYFVHGKTIQEIPTKVPTFRYSEWLRKVPISSKSGSSKM